MITEGQRYRHTLERIPAVLTRDYKPPGLNHVLPKGTLVEVTLYESFEGDLFVSDKNVDEYFPYDAAELLENK